MESKKFLLGTTALLMALGGAAHADRDPGIWEKPGIDQYRAFRDGRSLFMAAAEVDQFGDKMSPLGRLGVVEGCLNSAKENTVAWAVRWALCRDDFKALDMKALEKDLDDGDRQRIEEWKKLGAKIEADAKDDPGIAQILKQTEAAKADWKDFEAKNHDAIALFGKLKEGVRSNKSNDKSFDGCWDVTQPAFAKLVRATKFHWDNDGDDAVPGRVSELDTTPANYLTVANYGMCAFSVHASGGVLASAALTLKPGTTVLGWRTQLIAKVVDPAFKPKFTDRSLTWGDASGMFKGGDSDVAVTWPGNSMKIQTGVVKTMKKDGDDTLVTFTGSVVEDCLNWKETGKIRTWDTAGDPVYERICTKRGMVVDDAPDDTTFGTKLIDGFAKGVGVAFIGGFAEECYNDKAKKFVSILGVTVKGSPAEKPIIDKE